MIPSPEYPRAMKNEEDGYHQDETQITTPYMSKIEENNIKVACSNTDGSVGNCNNQRNENVSAGMVKRCNIMKNGMCEQHQKMSFKYQVSSQVWRDCGRGRGYGLVSKKVTKRICRVGKDLPIESNISTNNRDMSNMASKRIKVRVTCDGGLARGD